MSSKTISPRVSLMDVIQLIPQTYDPNPLVQKPAEIQISNLSKTEGFLVIMLDIISNKTIPDGIRSMASILFKNTVETYWNRNPERVISDVEKATVRSRILHVVKEEGMKVVATHLALSVGKIARTDWNANWPDMFLNVFSMIQDGNLSVRLAGLLLLHHILMVLRSKRLLTGIKKFKEIAPEIFNYVVRVWMGAINNFLQTLLSNVQSPGNINYDSMKLEGDLVKFCLKVLNGLLLAGFDEWSEANGVLPFLRGMLECWTATVNCRNNIHPHSPLKPYLLQFEKKFARILLETQSAHPTQWIPLLNTYLHFCLNQLKNYPVSSPSETASQASHDHERQAIVFMSFVKEVIKCELYNKQGSPGFDAISGFITNADHIKELFGILLFKFIVLTTEDLLMWKEQPEMFVCEEESDAYKTRKRPMAETLALEMLSLYKEIVGPLIVQLIHDTRNPMSFEQLLMKDACYSALVWSSFKLASDIDIVSWLNGQLEHELRNPDPNYKIIHRKIVLLLGQWISHIPASLLPVVYQLVVSMLGNSDMVISLSAAQTLPLLIKDDKFDGELYNGYLNRTISDLFKLIGITTNTDTKLKLLEVLGTLVEGMGAKMMPFINNFVELAFQFWHKFQSEKMVKLEVIRLLDNLVCNIQNTADFQVKLLPIIEYSINIDVPDSSDLLQEGLELWKNTVKHTPHMVSVDFIKLFAYAFKYLAISYENIFILMRIMEYYILLAQKQFIEMYFSDLEKFFFKSIGDTKDKATISMMKPLELLLLLFPKEIPPHFENVLKKVAINALFESNDDQESSIRVQVYYLTILCRLLLHNSEYFLNFLDRLSKTAEVTPFLSNNGNLLYLFISTVLEKIENAAERSRRKLMILSVVSLLCYIPTLSNNPQDPSLVDLLVLIITNAIGVMQDEESADPEAEAIPDASDEDQDDELYLPDIRNSDGLHQPLLNAPLVNSNIPEWRKLLKQDPVNFVTVRAMLKDKLAELAPKAPQLLTAVVHHLPNLIQELN